MDEKLLDRLADDTVSGLKGSFAHQVNNGEDPTTCMQMFLNFLESSKDKNPQFFKKIASKVDSTFFAPLTKVNQIASPDHFITTYHNLVNKLIEINPQMPYKADFERQKALIENEKNVIRERLRKEKEEKKRIVADEYKRLLSEWREEYKSGETGKVLRTSAEFCLILSVAFLLTCVLTPAKSDARLIVSCLIWFAAAVAAGFLASKTGGCELYLLHFFYALAGGVSTGIAGEPYLALALPFAGIIAGAVYLVKLNAIRLTREERADYNTSLGNIEKHFADKEKYEIAQSTVKILTMDR